MFNDLICTATYIVWLLLALGGCNSPNSQTEKQAQTEQPVVSEDDLYGRLASALIANPASQFERESNKMINLALDSLWNIQQLESGLFYDILRKGDGQSIAWGDRLRMHYEGKFLDNTTFDSSYKRENPLEFYVGNVIDGWNEGLELINVGGKVRLLVPSHLGYGEKGLIIAGRDTLVPPNEVLIFTIEVLDKLRK